MASDGHTPSDSERAVVVDDELEEAVHWVERELREARQALWDGKSGKAFASIEAAQDEFETVDRSLSADSEQTRDWPASGHGGECDGE